MNIKEWLLGRKTELVKVKEEVELDYNHCPRIEYHQKLISLGGKIAAYKEVINYLETHPLSEFDKIKPCSKAPANDEILRNY